MRLLIKIIAFLFPICLESKPNHEKIFTVPKCDRPNEYFACGSVCQNTCKNLLEPCLIEEKRCRDSCYCLPGYARDDKIIKDNLTCIPEWQCENKKGKCLGQNEVFESKGSPCQTTCARLGLPCPINNKKTVQGCFCRTGFARNSNGLCIPQENCPPGRCEDIYGVFKTVNCLKTCKSIRGCNTKDLYAFAQTTCACQIGYVHSKDDNKCVAEYSCYIDKDNYFFQ